MLENVRSSRKFGGSAWCSAGSGFDQHSRLRRNARKSSATAGLRLGPTLELPIWVEARPAYQLHSQ